TRPLGGVEALGEGVTAFQIPIITGQLHPLDTAGLETAGRTLYGAQGVIFLGDSAQVNAGLITVETELGTFTPMGGGGLEGQAYVHHVSHVLLLPFYWHFH